MKTALLAAALAGAAASVAAQSTTIDHMQHQGMHASAAVDAPLADGVVKKVDKAAGKVTLAHGPLPNGMPAMTMVFRLQDARWAEQLQPGQKIRFASREINGAMTVLRFETVQ